jgi:sialate O-acetylesterase
MYHLFKKYLVVLFFVLLELASFCQDNRIKVACLGNSVTYGLTLKNPQVSSYPSQLQKLLGGKYLVKNFGHSGATLLRRGHNPYYKTNEFQEALAFLPDIVIIHLGLNDTDPRDWPNYRDEFAADYSFLVDTFRKVNSKVKIFICRLSPIFSDHPRFKSGTRDWFWQIQSLISQIAIANKVELLDFHSKLYSRPDLFPDALHPNEEGASILARIAYQKITGDFGSLQLASVFASHMVVQRNHPIKFYGTADAGQKIVANFNGKQQTIFANDNGEWKAEFPAVSAGGPFTASFSSVDKNIILNDIFSGEVWLCSGQSNMYFALGSAISDKEEMAVAEKDKSLRFLKMKPIAETNDYAWDSATLQNVNELKYFSGTWEKCDSSKAKDFSAIAYYFGKKLRQALHVPIGLIEVAVGGSTTESWIDRYTMEHHPVLENELTNWRRSDFFQPWTRERADTNLKNAMNPRQRHPYEPCYNFEAGIESLVGFPIAGVIWYQGESNAHNVELHETVFPELVKSWRSQWGYSFPFYYVQLSSLNRPSWPSFRFSQFQLLKKVPYSGMAVSSDVGDPGNVHPKQKKPVGERLARLALHFTYGRKNIVPYGPVPARAIKSGDQIVVSFSYDNRLKTSDAKPLRGFRLVDERGFEKEVKAYIQNNKVMIPIEKNTKPVTVLYAWQPYSDANLVNSDNLPASTFKLYIQ